MDGLLTEVVTVTHGSAATAGVAAAETSVPVESLTDFASDGGRVDIAGVIYDYTGVDDSDVDADGVGGSVLLASPLTVAVDEFDPVLLLMGDEPAVDFYAVVDLIDDEAGEPVWVPLETREERLAWPVRVYDPPLPVTLSADLSQILRAPGVTPQMDGALIDPTTLPPLPGGQTISDDAPTDTTGYPEDYGWWQVDVDDNVVGFWRLVAGAWVPQTIVTAEALQAGNILADAIDATDLTGVNITGVTITGSTLRTGEYGSPHWVVTDFVGPDISGYTGSLDENWPAIVRVFGVTNGEHSLELAGPDAGDVVEPPRLMLTTDTGFPGDPTQAYLASETVIIKGHTTIMDGALDATMGNGSVGTGTFRDSVDARVVGSDTWHTVSSFTNTWTNRGATGHPPVSYRKSGDGDVRLRGHLSVGGASGTSAFTLPSGWRPDFEIGRIAIGASQLGTPAYLDILANGNCEIRYPTGTTYVSLNGVTFSTA